MQFKMDVEESLREDMRKLGCESPKKISLTYYLYVYLIDEKLMFDVEYCYNKDIDTLYVVAKPNKDDNLNIYVPLATSDKLSIEDIDKMQENLCTVETGPVINVAFIEADITIVIYAFTRGLSKRMDPIKLNNLRKKEQRRRQINSTLRKKKTEIVNNSLNGGVIDDDDDDCEILD